MTSPPTDVPLPGAFDGPALAATPEVFTHELAAPARTELGRLLDAIERGDDEAAIESAVHAATADATARTITALTSGPGFILLRGLPVQGRSRRALAVLYTMMGRAIGRPVPQNLDGELLTDVRDTGADPRDPDVRLYRTSAEQDFHTDGADVIGLLCLATASSGGASRLVSSVRVYQAVRARRPDLAPLLFEPWFFHLPGARARGLPEALPRPIATFDGRKLETFFIPLVHPERPGPWRRCRRSMRRVASYSRCTRRPPTIRRSPSTWNSVPAMCSGCATPSSCTSAPRTTTTPSPSVSATCSGCGWPLQYSTMLRLGSRSAAERHREDRHRTRAGAHGVEVAS